MLSENLKSLRLSKGLSQETLAVRLNVVRQTISKWEKGLSVPDSEMLIKIAEELETSVNVLLGETVSLEGEPELKAIAAKLEALNAQFAKRNERLRKIWRIVFIVIGSLAFLSLLKTFFGFIYLQAMENHLDASTSIIGGADGPTSILVSNIPVKYPTVAIAAFSAVVAIIGIIKTKRK